MLNQNDTESKAEPLDQPNYLMALMAGLQPAFRHNYTGESHLAVNEYGQANSAYSFTGLPEEWVVERDATGHALALHPDVIPGYWRDARFITIEELTHLPFDA